MKEAAPHTTKRAEAFRMWMKTPMPMVTLTRIFDVTRLVRISKKHGLKFNMLMCWCISRAASTIEEFLMLPVNGKLIQYDKLAVNVIVANRNGGINSCDIPFDNDFAKFIKDYDTLTEQCRRECKYQTENDRMIIGTSALVETELDSVVNMWSGVYANPMLFWGKRRRHWWRTLLPVSFQFHHVQMDGREAAQFLNSLQQVLSNNTDYA